MSITAPASAQSVELPAAVLATVSIAGQVTPAFQPKEGAGNIVWGTLSEDDDIVRGTSSGDDNIVRGTLFDDDDIVWET